MKYSNVIDPMIGPTLRRFFSITSSYMPKVRTQLNSCHFTLDISLDLLLHRNASYLCLAGTLGISSLSSLLALSLEVHGPLI